MPTRVDTGDSGLAASAGVNGALVALLGGLAMGGSSRAETRMQSGSLVGRVQPRPSRAIVASPLGIGFETLDRRMFDPQRTYAHLAELGVK